MISFPRFESFSFARNAAIVVAGAACLLGATRAGAAEPNEDFSAQLTTQEIVAPNPAECAYLSGHATGAGHAKHLGAVTITMHDCISPGGPPLAFGGGIATITAANGDTITFSYSGLLVPTATTATTGVFAIDPTATQFTVTGGTGRFAGATGSGSVSGDVNVVNGAGHINFDGVLARR